MVAKVNSQLGSDLLSRLWAQEVHRQQQLDKSILSLTDTMLDTYDLVISAGEISKEKCPIVVRMVQQTTECALFIHDYQKVVEFCESHIDCFAFALIRGISREANGYQRHREIKGCCEDIRKEVR